MDENGLVSIRGHGSNSPKEPFGGSTRWFRVLEKWNEMEERITWRSCTFTTGIGVDGSVGLDEESGRESTRLLSGTSQKWNEKCAQSTNGNWIVNQEIGGV